MKNQTQDSYLTACTEEKKDVTIYLMNGFQMKGHILGFDNFSVTVESDGKTSLIFKHAISTITPIKG